MAVCCQNKHKNLIIKDTIDHSVLFCNLAAPTTIWLSF